MVGEDIVRYIKAGEQRAINAIMKWKPVTGRKRGRLKSKWQEEAEENLRKMEVRRWNEVVMDRKGES